MRRAHSLASVAQTATARTSDNDVVLDALLLRLHTETGCHRGGALGLRLTDLGTDNCPVQLRSAEAPGAGQRGGGLDGGAAQLLGVDVVPPPQVR